MYSDLMNKHLLSDPPNVLIAHIRLAFQGPTVPKNSTSAASLLCSQECSLRSHPSLHQHQHHHSHHRLPIKCFFSTQYKNAGKRSRQHARSSEGHLPPKVVFYQRSSSSVGRLPTNVIFHRKMSSSLGCLSQKVVFHQRLSSTDSHLPPKIVCH